jgi:hypothetical protein
MMAQSSEWIDPMLQIGGNMPDLVPWEEWEPLVHDSVYVPDPGYNELFDYWDHPDDPDDPEPTTGPTAPEATQLLADFMIDKWCHGKMAAVDLCMMCFWMKAAGMSGLIAELAKMPKPNQRGKCRDHIRRKLGLDKETGRFDKLALPSSDKSDGSRITHNMYVLNPHDAINMEVADDPTIHDTLAQHVADGKLPPSYMEHPVARASGHKALPCFLYIDGVPTTKHDGVIGFWVYCAISLRRHLVAVLRKSRICQCGCSGWCSFYVMFLWLHWSFFSMADGTHPELTLFGQVRGVDDPIMAALAGTALLYSAAIIGIKCDWQELATTFGLSNWKTSLAPCALCMATVRNMYDDETLQVGEPCWEDVTTEMYSEECDRSEIIIVAGADLVRKILPALKYDKRKSTGSSHGRALQWDISGTSLKKHDRLEPSRTLPDVAALEEVKTFPIELTFWRTGVQHRTKHRNPLFDDAIGIGMPQVLVDQLHALNLGVMKLFAQELLWELMWRCVWVDKNGRVQDDWIACNLIIVRGLLSEWQDSYARAHPGHKQTVIQQITPGMVGTPGNRCLALKAAETKYFFLFLCDLLPAHVHSLPQGGKWLAAATTLRTLISRFTELPWHLENGNVQELV